MAFIHPNKARVGACPRPRKGPRIGIEDAVMFDEAGDVGVTTEEDITFAKRFFQRALVMNHKNDMIALAEVTDVAHR